jgi:hypothetical protein
MVDDILTVERRNLDDLIRMTAPLSWKREAPPISSLAA